MSCRKSKNQRFLKVGLNFDSTISFRMNVPILNNRVSSKNTSPRSLFGSDAESETTCIRQYKRTYNFSKKYVIIILENIYKKILCWNIKQKKLVQFQNFRSSLKSGTIFIFVSATQLYKESKLSETNVFLKNNPLEKQMLNFIKLVFSNINSTVNSSIWKFL